MHEKRRPRFFDYLGIWGYIPANIFLFNINNRNGKKGVKNAQS